MTTNRYDELSDRARWFMENYDELDRAAICASTETERDGAYRERAHLVALLAATTDQAVITPALDLDEPGWWIVYLNLGGRQASWHIAPRDAGLFAHVERVEPDDPRAQWDGHTTEEKYAGIAAHTAELAQPCGPARAEQHTETGRAEEQPAPTVTTGLVIEPYRNDQGQPRWVFRCWGTDTCDGWLSLDHHSEQSAQRARDRHVSEEHPSEEQLMPTCNATIEGPHVPGGPVQCTREAGHPENHVGPAQGDDGKVLWTDYHAGATPHRATEERT